jgi:Helix-turn-helix domain
MPQLSTAFKPQFIKVADAAALLQVSTSTIHNWIKADAIPYIELPRSEGQRAEYRIPLRGLIASLHGNYDLEAELDALADAARNAGVDAESLIRAGGGEPESVDDE